LNFFERWNWEELRHKLVLTPEEKRVITFVIAAFFLGLTTKCYRDTHPQLPDSVGIPHLWKKSATASPSTARKQKRNRAKQSATPTESADP
jgi:hypothetical protein